MVAIKRTFVQALSSELDKKLFLLIYILLFVKLTLELKLYQARHPTHCLLVCHLILLALHRKMMSCQVNIYICQGQSLFNGLARMEYWIDANVKHNHHQLQLWGAYWWLVPWLQESLETTLAKQVVTIAAAPRELKFFLMVREEIIFITTVKTRV